MTKSKDIKNKLVKENSQFLLNGFPVLGLPDEQREVKYFSLNPFLPDKKNRCPLECAYCICYQDGQWHNHPELFDDTTRDEHLISNCLDEVFNTAEGQAGFPISLYDYSDPFINVHKQNVIKTMKQIGERRFNNMIYITTKVHPGIAYLKSLKATFDAYPNLRPTIYVSLPPLKKGYEPVSIAKRVQLIKDCVALGLPCCWYLRPLNELWYDEALMWQLTRELLPYVHDHILFSGTIMSEAIEDNLLNKGLTAPKWQKQDANKKQLLSVEFETHLRKLLNTVSDELKVKLGPVMSHRLCGSNGNYKYGCLHCDKNDRYCQLFQLHHFDDAIENVPKESLIKMIEVDDSKNE